MLSEREKTLELVRFGIEMGQIKDLDLLLERILTLARTFVHADAGSIYVRTNNQLKFVQTQNETLIKRLAPGKKLVYHTFELPIDNMTIAGYVANTGKVLNIPDVYSLPNDISYQFGRKFDQVAKYQTRSMLTVPLTTTQENRIGILQMINRLDEANTIIPFSQEDEHYIQYFANTAAVALDRAQMTRAIILRMISMAELRDPNETGAHVHRVGAYSVELYEAWARNHKIGEDTLNKNRDILRMAAMLHDVGKVGISDIILKKPGALTAEEYLVMQYHTVAGARLFEDPTSTLDNLSAEIALNHHERWDGSGYPGFVDDSTGHPIEGYMTQDGKPRGKGKDEIPLFGRIVAIADVFDALCSRRSYKEPWPEEKALAEIENQAGKMFDPELVKMFFSIQDLIAAIKQRYPDTE